MSFLGGWGENYICEIEVQRSGEGPRKAEGHWLLADAADLDWDPLRPFAA